MKEELAVLHRSEKSLVTLLLDTETGKRSVRKVLRGQHPVYEQLTALTHPYLPKLYSVTQMETEMILEEEYIEGVSLGQTVLSERQLRMLLIELCEVLTFLHGHGILHRDIKPSNLLLAPDGHLRLIDFDAAREQKTESTESDTRLLGTRGFAPPEQYGFAQTDARADIYAVGVTMKRLLGQRAERGPYRHMIRKCTEFSPSRRYKTAQALMRDLKAYSLRRLFPWAVTAVLLVGIVLFARWYSDNSAEIVSNRYPDEPLLFYATQGDTVIAALDDLRNHGQTHSMQVDLDGDGHKEELALYADVNGSIHGEITSGVPVQDGIYTGMDLVEWMGIDIPLERYLSAATAQTWDLPDSYFVQITCLDLDPYEKNGKEVVACVGDMQSEVVAAVYAYQGTVDTPAEYRGTMWGAERIRRTETDALETTLEQNPYGDSNLYVYEAGAISEVTVVDYEKYRAAVNRDLSPEQWHDAISSVD
ncbi:MAG: serine/threonine-protein kinase [Alphaproteobacteria bacterium]|nr:serine/threonine-protein kinase [Alphaproteobacteria bacterium]